MVEDSLIGIKISTFLVLLYVLVRSMTFVVVTPYFTVFYIRILSLFAM